MSASATITELLPGRILAELARQPGQKAAGLAAALGADRKAINQCLYGPLRGKVRQDRSYRWYLANHREPAPEAPRRPADTDLSRLCRYYLDCIGADTAKGVSAFAASRYGPPDYAELPALPGLGGDSAWWQADGASRLLGKVRNDRANLTAWIGYPVRLRHHRSAKWEGYFAEPVLLWAVDSDGDQPIVGDDLPALNFAFLKSLAVGDPGHLVAEAAQLAVDLNLNTGPGDQPEMDEMLHRLKEVRPDWDWREDLIPECCSQTPPLAEIDAQGIYNRAILCVGERSPYTQGLETELKALANCPQADLAGTALGAWLSGEFAAPEPTGPNPPVESLLEVVPMNTEQRQGVMSALTRPITVITGPPGTGKSQIVTNLLINAAWRGKRVLFASKNNKAVDVVEVRVNELVDGRPALFRLGSRDSQARVSAYLTAMLSGATTPDDQREHDEALVRHRQLGSRAQELDKLEADLLKARNTACRLAEEVEEYRELFGAQQFAALDPSVVSTAQPAVAAYRHALDRADPAGRGPLSRLMARLGRSSRLRAVEQARRAAAGPAEKLGGRLPSLGEPPDFRACRDAIGKLGSRLDAAGKVVRYQAALAALRGAVPAEVLGQRRLELGRSVADNSVGLWRSFLRLLSARLTNEQRRQISDYIAILQVITASERSGGVSAAIRNRARRLQQQVTGLFSCWAVTSLSARGRIPLTPGLFDLVVIDEASQCDIASALPLLFRAKRAAIIGDPQQLKHISALAPKKDAELQEKYRIFEKRAAWMYSTSSLFDLAAGLAGNGEIVSLRDHFRSHADIIEFPNRHFYSDRPLRVATRYDRLRRPNPSQPGVTWQNVPGQAERPAGGGARNHAEAVAIIAYLKDLLLTRGYQGSVGVVTPFRAQVQMLQEMAAADAVLAACGARPSTALLISTVHQFQGDERDLMVFSPVVATGIGDGALGFLRGNGNLFNVAITRARGQLHIIGDLGFAAHSGVKYLEHFAAYVTDLQAKHRKAEGGIVVPENLGQDYPAVARPERVNLDLEPMFYRALFAAGLRPIPQYSVEQYDLDFALVDCNRRLDIEVDGGQHRLWTGEQCLRDRIRDMRLIELGWEVKRFLNIEVQDHLQQCVEWVVRWAKPPQQFG